MVWENERETYETDQSSDARESRDEAVALTASVLKTPIEYLSVEISLDKYLENEYENIVVNGHNTVFL